VLRNLRTTGFRGRVVAIHPTAAELEGFAAYPRLADAPGELDLVVIVVPAAAVLDVVRDAIAKRVRAIVVISAGFAESGPEGRAREQALLDLVRAAGVRLIGPNCMGILNADPQVALNATFSPSFPPGGRVAFSTQSGALGLAILDYAKRVNLGISTFASIGNKADVSSNDLLQYWADDPHTSVILLYLESFGNPRKFAQLARSVGRTKPIVALKAGRSAAGARAAMSHTGALAASDRIVDALFKQAGVIRTLTIEEMFDVAVLLDQQPLPRGKRVAILTNAGGPGILAADACEARGLEVAALAAHTVAELRTFLPAAAGLNNPIDMLATASPANYEHAAQVLLADPNVDSLLTIFIPPVVTAAVDVAAHLKSAATLFQKPVVATFMSVDDAIPMLAPIPCYRFPEAAAAALARAAEYDRWRRQPLGRVADCHDAVTRAREIIARARTDADGWLAPQDAHRALAALGIVTTDTRTATSEADAVETAAALGYPVALKGFGPGILHKSDVGAVHLNLGDADAVRAAYRAMAAALGTALAGVVVQRMAPDGVEMFIGGLQDAVFGPVVFAGSGGVLVELFGDAACRMCPATDRDVEEMLAEVRGIARLRGHRGAARADEGAYREAILRVAALLDACPEIHEMDVNPIRVGQAGVCILDARIRVGRPARPRPARRVRY
jgi:acyl-CoA synthetase (NDP forming)